MSRYRELRDMKESLNDGDPLPFKYQPMVVKVSSIVVVLVVSGLFVSLLVGLKFA